MTPEIEACINKAAIEASKQTKNDVLGMLGIEDNEDGRQAMKALGDFAKLWSDVRYEARKQGIKGTIKGVYWIVKLIVLGGLAYLAWRAGWIGK